MEIWHETAGDGPPVLLLHAGVCDGRMWDPQWATWADSHRLVRCDLRGFGRTPLPAEPFAHAADVAELLGALDLGPVAVVGASFGGLVALDLALAHPELVSRLVLIGAPLPGYDWSQEFREFAAAEDAALAAGRIDDAVEVNLRMWVGGADPEVRRRVGEMQGRAFELQLAAGDEAEDELLIPDLPERLGDVGVPALIVAGEHDVADMQAIADRLAAVIPGAERATIPGAGHLPSLERPAEFDRLALPFIAPWA